MPYVIAQDELNRLGELLAAYYEEAWEAGIKSRFDIIARSGMGVVTGYLDVAADTFANLRKKSSDSFFTTFRPALKQQVSLYFANKNDVAGDLVTIGEKAINLLASKIPIPLLGSAISAVTSFASGKGRNELHQRSIAEADKQLVTKTGADLKKLFSTDTEAQEYAKSSIEQYKTICKFIQLLPKTISTFDEAVTFPAAAFKVQAAASHLNVALLALSTYLEAMQSRLVQVQTVSKEYIATVRKAMPAGVKNVLDGAYDQGKVKGTEDIRRNKYAKPGEPTLQRPSRPGGATHLAVYVAHALAKGYYDAGNTGPIPGTGSFITRPRSSSIAPPLPFKR